MKKIKLRKITDEDIELLTSWLNKKYIKKWYNEPEDWLTEINGRHTEYSWINHFIVMNDEKSIGFCQYYDCFDAKDFEDWYSVDTAGKMYSIDYLIGNEDYLGKGYGKLIVKELTELISSKENAQIIVVQPDTGNTASNNVLISNGYTLDQEKQYYYKNLSRLVKKTITVSEHWENI
ncbi:GNAT family N-acetyltransferase [Listeria seeligeri]|nr:GNAT family N-acetyltransferase [Listeria seeligeri]MBC1444827.1 GNAT family N-acetyltransferase [Listeria seeligeri]MBC1773739.1 GNAT family N-acetyltransferase [Listeria seeligeri]MBF2384501.1 GNAT family N-acetyltransferase [Listeria seeligeri]MBF2541737.1 GNAT family N-acetyltransferase [Listeria seeligeri]MBF2590230.1 GNAT family N-acetyltransferase [Listeria seeligeri]